MLQEVLIDFEIVDIWLYFREINIDIAKDPWRKLVIHIASIFICKTECQSENVISTADLYYQKHNIFKGNIGIRPCCYLILETYV